MAPEVLAFSDEFAVCSNPVSRARGEFKLGLDSTPFLNHHATYGSEIPIQITSRQRMPELAAAQQLIEHRHAGHCDARSPRVPRSIDARQPGMRS